MLFALVCKDFNKLTCAKIYFLVLRGFVIFPTADGVRCVTLPVSWLAMLDLHPIRIPSMWDPICILRMNNLKCDIINIIHSSVDLKTSSHNLLMIDYVRIPSMGDPICINSTEKNE